MGHCTWWLTIALCSSALAASRGPEFMDTDTNEVESQPAIQSSDEQDFNNERLNLTRDFMDTNPNEVNGEPFFEGDMLLTESQWRAIRERKGVALVNRRWKDGPDGYPLVPYTFGRNRRLNKKAIQRGINHWKKHTCINFVKKKRSRRTHLRFVYGRGCYSRVGMQRTKVQRVSIGRRCRRLGIVAHQIGHAMGFYHEISRTDRNKYVKINGQNIKKKTNRYFYRIKNKFIDSRNIKYDYSSVMHDISTKFTKNGKTTIATLNPLTQGIIGQRSGLSHRDKHLANIMYKCIDKWLAKCKVSTDPCKNGGYYGANCKCVCPPGTSGSNCETKTGGYYDALINSCTEKVTKEVTLTSPNFPKKYPATQCVKWIKAPKCHVPKLTFDYFRLSGKRRYCFVDALEIRTKYKYDGDVYCGTDIRKGKSIIGKYRTMMLYFRTRSRRFKGWSAKLTFVKRKGCK